MLYHENLFVRVRSAIKNLRGLMDIKGIPVFLEGRKAESCRHCAMSVDFDRLNTRSRTKNQDDKPCYVIAASDVELLCQSLLFEHMVVQNNILNIGEFKVTIHRMCDDMLSKIPARNSPQRRLLEPFTVLHSVPHFKIAGPANTEYCASIAARVSRTGPTAGEYFNKVIELRDKGLNHLNRNDLQGAVKLIKSAYSQLITTCVRRKAVEPESAGFHPELIGAIVDTSTTLVAHLVFLHYRLDDMDDTHYWACNALQYGSRRSMTTRRENLYAKLVYLKAIASARMGRQARAVEDLCEGLKAVTRDAYKDRELVAMRREARYRIKGLGGIRVLKAMGIGYL